MAVVKCPQGHFYDDNKYQECPHCQEGITGKDQKTVAARQFVVQELSSIVTGATGGDEKTVSINFRRTKADPVVGWFVCIAGPEKGRDYRIRAGRNYLGRGLKMDVAIVDDEEISREDHCSIVFEPIANSFSMLPGKGAPVYCNSCLITEPLAVNDQDVIKLGSSELVLVQFCKGGRRWD